MDLKNTARIIATIITACIFLSSCASKPSQTPNPTTIAGPALTRIRIGVDPNFAPFETLSPGKNELVGFDIDLIKAISAKTDLQIELVKIITGTDQLLGSIEDCGLDAGISAIPISDNLKKRFDLSDPYYSTNSVVVVKKGNIKISGLDTLSGMVVGTQKDSPGQVDIEKIISAQPELFNTYYLAFDSLANGNIDAIIADSPRAYANVNIKHNNLKIVGEPFGKVEYGIAVCKGKTELLKQINDGLASMKADGSLDKLVKKWLTNISQQK
jgi:ABC-type amino acid transport substrate-binding protein